MVMSAAAFPINELRLALIFMSLSGPWTLPVTLKIYPFANLLRSSFPSFIHTDTNLLKPSVVMLTFLIVPSNKVVSISGRPTIVPSARHEKPPLCEEALMLLNLKSLTYPDAFPEMVSPRSLPLSAFAKYAIVLKSRTLSATSASILTSVMYSLKAVTSG